MYCKNSNVWVETEKINEESVKSTLLGFEFDKSKVKAQISNLATVSSEYNQMARGVQDPAEYMDEFKEKLMEAGLQDVYDEVKAQLEVYFENLNK